MERDTYCNGDCSGDINKETCVQTDMEIEVDAKVPSTKLLAKYLNGVEWDLKWRLVEINVCG